MEKSVIILRSNNISPDPRVEKTAKSLIKNGYQVNVIGWDRNSRSNSRDVLQFESSLVKINKVGILATFGGGMKNLFPLFFWQWKLFCYLLKFRNDYNIIHACDFDTVLPALIMKVLYKKKVIYDIFDFYVDSFGVPKLLRPLVRRLDYIAIKLSNAIILVNENRLNQIKGSSPKQVVYIHNTPDLDLSPIEQITNNKQISKLKIGYVGVLQDYRFLLEMLDIITNNIQYELHVAGFGKLENKFRDAGQKLSNLTYYGKVDYNRALEISSKVDVLFAIYDPKIPNHKYSSPNKLYEAMMLGKPILVARNTGIDEFVKNHGIGLVVDYNDKGTVIKALENLSKDASLLLKIKKKSKDLYFNNYAWSVMEKRLIDLYRNI